MPWNSASPQTLKPIFAARTALGHGIEPWSHFVLARATFPAVRAFHGWGWASFAYLLRGSFKGMGSMLTNVVDLTFVAALFAAGLQTTGLMNLLIESAKSLRMGMTGTGIVLSFVIALVTVLTSSGVASFTGSSRSRRPLPRPGGRPATLAMMLQLASELARPLSPVASIVIIMAGFQPLPPSPKVCRQTDGLTPQSSLKRCLKVTGESNPQRPAIDSTEPLPVSGISCAARSLACMIQALDDSLVARLKAREKVLGLMAARDARRPRLRVARHHHGDLL